MEPPGAVFEVIIVLLRCNGHDADPKDRLLRKVLINGILPLENILLMDIMGLLFKIHQ